MPNTTPFPSSRRFGRYIRRCFDRFLFLCCRSLRSSRYATFRIRLFRCDRLKLYYRQLYRCLFRSRSRFCSSLSCQRPHYELLIAHCPTCYPFRNFVHVSSDLSYGNLLNSSYRIRYYSDFQTRPPLLPEPMFEELPNMHPGKRWFR